MKQEDLEQIIEAARQKKLFRLSLPGEGITKLPDSIGDLVNLTDLFLQFNQLTVLPKSLVKLSKLQTLWLGNNRLAQAQESICNISSLTDLSIGNNGISILSKNISNLSNLKELSLCSNQISVLPESMRNLTNLTYLDIADNDLADLTILQDIPSLLEVRYDPSSGDFLHRRYWTQFSDWKPKWLLEEHLHAVRDTLIKHVGYERICQELGTVIGTGGNYTLLDIENAGSMFCYDNNSELTSMFKLPMLVLKVINQSKQINFRRIGFGLATIPLGKGLYESQTYLSSNCLARIIFCWDEKACDRKRIVPLHAVIQDREISKQDLDLALIRKLNLGIENDE
jgi:hypothetical protein